MASAILVTIVWLIVGITDWIAAPFPGFLVLENGVVASAGLTHWPTIADGSIFQSKVTSYDGHPFSTPGALKAYVASKPIDHSIEYRFESRTGRFERTIATRLFTPSDAFLLFGVTLFSAIALLGVALALFYMAPRDSAGIGCALAFAITGTFALTAVDLYGPYHFFRIHALAECFLGAGGIHMSLVFPHRTRVSIERPWIVFGAYFVSAIIGTTNQFLLYHPAGYTLTHLVAMAWAGIAFASIVVSQIAAFIRPSSYAARQRVLILAVGTFASITPAVLVAVGSSITGGEAPENLISWTGAFFPLAVGYAVLKSDLLEVDSVLRRTVNYVLLTIVVGSVYTAFITLIEWALRDSISTSKTLTTIAFSVFFSLAVLPIRDQLQSWVDRIFFRSAYDFRTTIEDASNRLARLIELDLIRDRIATTIRDTLNPESIDLQIIPETGSQSPEAPEFQASDVEPADLASGGIEIPFHSRDRRVGRLSLGRKLSGHYYSGLDRALLKVLANQGAIAIENALAVSRLQDLNRTLELRVTERTTELASALDNLTSTQAQLVQAERLAAVGELAAGVAHEVNNPLNFARNSLRTLQSLVAELVEYSEAIASLDPSDESDFRSKSEEIKRRFGQVDIHELADDVKQLAEILGTGLDRTARLVQDLRDFATPKQVVRAPYQFSALIDDAIQLTSSTFRENGIEIRHRVEPDEPCLIGDSRAISQVILNILKNAVDALEDSSNALIEIEVGTDSDSNSLAIEFKDNGPGIRPENVDQLFEPFFSTKPPGKGTGLGLALCKRVIQEHRGEIRIASRDAGGATVRIQMPLTLPPEDDGALAQRS